MITGNDLKHIRNKLMRNHDKGKRFTISALAKKFDIKQATIKHMELDIAPVRHDLTEFLMPIYIKLCEKKKKFQKDREIIAKYTDYKQKTAKKSTKSRKTNENQQKLTENNTKNPRQTTVKYKVRNRLYQNLVIVINPDTKVIDIYPDKRVKDGIMLPGHQVLYTEDDNPEVTYTKVPIDLIVT